MTFKPRKRFPNATKTPRSYEFPNRMYYIKFPSIVLVCLNHNSYKSVALLSMIIISCTLRADPSSSGSTVSLIFLRFASIRSRKTDSTTPWIFFVTEFHACQSKVRMPEQHSPIRASNNMTKNNSLALQRQQKQQQQQQ